MREVYERIGEIAISSGSMTLSELNEILTEEGMGYGSNRGLAKAVSAAYGAWEEEYPDQGTHTEIANTYTDRNGNLPWDL